MKRRTADNITWVAVMIAALIVIVPWQGALDRVGDAAALPPVPTAKGYTETALALLDAGLWWRVEPDYSLFLVRNAEFAARGARHWHIVSAYGPWSFLFRGYHPGNYVPLLAAWGCMAIASMLLLRRALRGAGPAESIAIAVTMLLVLAANPRAGLLMVFPLLIVRAWFAERLPGVLLIPAIALLAMTGLVKSSSLVLGLIVVAAIAVDELRSRRVPRALLIYLASFLIWWFAAGQDAAWLGPFLRGTWHVSSAYGEAEFSGSMSLMTALLLVIAAIVVILLAFTTWKRRRAAGFIEVIALTAIVFAFIKTALVRDDMFHAELGPMAIMALLLVYAGPIAAMTRSRRVIVSSAAAAAVLVLLPFLPQPRELGRQVRAAMNPAAARRSSDAFYARDTFAILSRTPLPPIAGSVDVYGDRQSVAIAHGLDYQPRPVYQSYIAYDAALASMNANHLHGADAPRFILFGMSITDERFPSLDDGLSWPELLTRYRPVAATPELLLLRRATHDGAYRLLRRRVIHARLGDRVALSTGCGPLVWAEVNVRTTLAGKVLATAYKVPELTLSVDTARGEHLSGRLIRRVASAGFLLSPVVVGPLDFGALAAGNVNSLAPRNVRSLVVKSDVAFAYEDDITIVISDLEIVPPR